MISARDIHPLSEVICIISKSKKDVSDIRFPLSITLLHRTPSLISPSKYLHVRICELNLCTEHQ